MSYEDTDRRLDPLNIMHDDMQLPNYMHIKVHFRIYIWYPRAEILCDCN